MNRLQRAAIAILIGVALGALAYPLWDRADPPEPTEAATPQAVATIATPTAATLTPSPTSYVLATVIEPSTAPVYEPPPTSRNPGVTGVLTREDMRSVLVTADWPEGWIEDAIRVACGPGVTRSGLAAPSGESGCDKGAEGEAEEIGLFQIMPGWSEFCGLGSRSEWLFYPLANAGCALAIVEDSIARGLDPWHHWSVRPR